MEIPVIRLASGFPLYHLAYRNVPENYEDIFEEWEEWGYTMPREGGYSTDLEHPKYFSLTKYHPFYYGADPNGYKSVALQYRTKEEILLLNPVELNWKETVDIGSLIEQLKRMPQCVDGWLVVDDIPFLEVDMNKIWKEIFLLRPWEKVDPNFIEYQLSPEEMRYARAVKEYEWGQLEAETIEAFTLEKGLLTLEDQACHLVMESQ